MRSELGELRRLLEGTADGTLPSGSDVEIPNEEDPRLVKLGERLLELRSGLESASKAVRLFRGIGELALVLPEDDPRRLGGLLVEMDKDVEVLGLALERLGPKVREALEACGVGGDGSRGVR